MTTDHASAHTNAASWNMKKAMGRCGEVSFGDILDAHRSRAASQYRENMDCSSKSWADARAERLITIEQHVRGCTSYALRRMVWSECCVSVA